MANKRTSASRLMSRCVKAPIRLLGRACDFYVRTMTSFGSKLQHGGGGGLVYAPVGTLPRSFSVQSASSSTTGDDDLRELIRAASVARRGAGGDSGVVGLAGRVPRSQSVAIGRIDEDVPCEFGHEVRIGRDYLLPRSRSYAVAPANRRFQGFA